MKSLFVNQREVQPFFCLRASEVRWKVNKQCKMKRSATTYTAPGQGLTSLVLAAVSYFASVNQTASQLFNGKLTNAFVWRCIIGTPALSVALVLESFRLFRPWAVTFLCLALATLIPAFTEFALNTEEE